MATNMGPGWDPRSVPQRRATTPNPTPQQRTLGYTSPTPYKPPTPPPSTRAPSTPTGSRTGGGVLSTPGWGEKWYSKNQDWFTKPGQSQNYWNGVQGFFAPGMSPAEQGMWNIAQGFQNRPSGAEGWYADNRSQFQAPSRRESNFDEMSGMLRNPGALEDFWSQQGGQFGKAGTYENWYADNGQTLMRTPHKSGQLFNDVRGSLLGGDPYSMNLREIVENYDDIKNSEDWYRTAKPVLSKAGYTERMADDYRPELSYSEGMFTGDGPSSLERMYDRLYQKGSERLANEGAARGSYNSGASLQATADMGLDLDSQHTRDMINLAGQSDSAKMARLGEGRALMQGADSAMNNRFGTGGQLGSMADQSANMRAKGVQDAYKTGADVMFQGIGMAGNLAGQSDDQDIRRFDSTRAGALDSQQAMFNRLLQGGQLAGQAQGAENTRFNTLMSGSQTADQGFLDRMDRDLTGAQASDDGYNTRMDKASQGFRDSQDSTLKRILDGGTLARDASGEEFDRMGAGGDSAFAAQDAMEGRVRGELTDTLEVGERMSRLFTDAMGQARDEQTRIQLEEVQGLLKNGSISAADAEAMVKNILGTVQMGVDALPPGIPAPKT